jgi:hypothetical protein
MAIGVAAELPPQRQSPPELLALPNYTKFQWYSLYACMMCVQTTVVCPAAGLMTKCQQLKRAEAAPHQHGNRIMNIRQNNAHAHKNKKTFQHL